MAQDEEEDGQLLMKNVLEDLFIEEIDSIRKSIERKMIIDLLICVVGRDFLCTDAVLVTGRTVVTCRRVVSDRL